MKGPTVRVFVNGLDKPSLVVDRIGAEENGWIGFWVGAGSDGKFANLKVQPEN